jgi:hypothetical protein
MLYLKEMDENMYGKLCAVAGVRRAGTIVRSPLDRKERKAAVDGDMSAADVCLLKTNHDIFSTSTFVLGIRACPRADSTDGL